MDTTIPNKPKPNSPSKKIKAVSFWGSQELIENEQTLEYYYPLPPDMKKAFQEYLGIEDLDQLCAIWECISDDDYHHEEIWEPRDFINFDKKFDCEDHESVGWGGLGTILFTNGTSIPVAFTQNASPIAFFFNPKYADLVKQVEQIEQIEQP